MEQFAFGSADAFENLWNRLAVAPKVIRYRVTLAPDISARLVFESRQDTRVAVRLAEYAERDRSRYGGSSEFARALLAGAEATFGSAAELRERFSDLRGDYAARTAEAQRSAPSAERSLWKSACVDPTELAVELKARVVGQDEQIDGICECVCNHLRKKRPRRPLTIMLPGPTGVGKSETACALADALQSRFGAERMPLIRVNCNEYRESHRISQFIGSPAGYVGYGDACVMECVKRTDSVIVLFDEFEKAHADIHTAVMGWLDSGKITLSRIDAGESSAEYACAPSIIIMTSNIDVRRKSRAKIGIAPPVNGDSVGVLRADSAFARNDDCRGAMVKNGFKPEIAGRISYFFEYKPLSDESCKKILELAFMRKAGEYGAVIESIDAELGRDMFERFGRSPFGARPFEYALDSILGRQIPDIDGDKEKRYTVSGTLDRLVFTETEAENATAGI